MTDVGETDDQNQQRYHHQDKYISKRPLSKSIINNAALPQMPLQVPKLGKLTINTCAIDMENAHCTRLFFPSTTVDGMVINVLLSNRNLYEQCGYQSAVNTKNPLELSELCDAVHPEGLFTVEIEANTNTYANFVWEGEKDDDYRGSSNQLFDLDTVQRA